MRFHALSVGEVMQLALLVDDAHCSLLCADAHMLDVVRRLSTSLELFMQNMCRLDGRLCVELGGVRDLEEHVLHDVRAVRHLELEWLALCPKISSKFSYQLRRHDVP